MADFDALLQSLKRNEGLPLTRTRQERADPFNPLLLEQQRFQDAVIRNVKMAEERLPKEQAEQFKQQSFQELRDFGKKVREEVSKEKDIFRQLFRQKEGILPFNGESEPSPEEMQRMRILKELGVSPEDVRSI